MSSHALIAKVTVQNLLQQIQHVQILLTFSPDNEHEATIPLAIQNTLQTMRSQLNDLEYRLQTMI
jgi:hypothetical protein